jgi:magnesium chelatase family protein
LDRIDIIVEVPAVKFDDLQDRRETEPSVDIRSRVNAAREIQHNRFEQTGAMCNARMGPDEMRRFCQLNADSSELMRQAFDTFGLTARSYDRILRVARTIADLDNSASIEMEHIAEAIQYRTVNI